MTPGCWWDFYVPPETFTWVNLTCSTKSIPGVLRLTPHFVSVSRPQSLVKPVSPEDGEERKLSEALKTQEGRRTRAPMTVSTKLRQEKEQQEPGVGLNRARTGTQLRVGQENTQDGEQGRNAAKGRGNPPGHQHPEPASEKKAAVRGRPWDKEGQGAGAPREEPRKEVGEPPKRASPELGGCRLREVKILTRQGSRSVEEKTALVVSASQEQQVSRSRQGSSPWGESSWVLGGQQTEGEPKMGGNGTCGLWGKL